MVNLGLMAETAAPNSVFQELIEEMARCLPPESVAALANFKVSDATLARLDALATKANEGQLTPEEAADYRAYIEMSDLLAILRLRAQVRL
jgi:hypothetical protein